jgi:toxin ParE1/3/4
VHAVSWSPAAVAQLRAIRAYLQQFNPKAAETLAAHLLVAGNSLESFPHRGRRVLGTEMRELVTTYPHIIRYRVTREGLVRILRVRHAARQRIKP